MANDEGQEKTEDATEKRLRDAREKGQVQRSKELNTMIVTFGSVLGIMTMGSHVADTLRKICYDAFTLNKSEIFDDVIMLKHFSQLVMEASISMIPFLLILLIAAAIAPTFVGGLNFSVESCSPKLERIDPIKGLKKIFSIKILIELLKAVLKLGLVMLAFLIVIQVNLDEVMSLEKYSSHSGIEAAIDILTQAIFFMTIPLVFVAIIDVPYQKWDFAKQMKMSKQEIKDEFKETDGKPEVKQKLRSLQMEMRKRRMMSDVPDADVVITNPDHFAVAIKYDENGAGAPIVLAKGADLIAEMIKKVAKAHKVPIVSAPPLARAIFYSVDLQEEIPTGLYVAVAKILAYVYELKLYKVGKADKPTLPKDYDIPEELKR